MQYNPVHPFGMSIVQLTPAPAHQQPAYNDFAAMQHGYLQAPSFNQFYHQIALPSSSLPYWKVETSRHLSPCYYTTNQQLSPQRVMTTLPLTTNHVSAYKKETESTATVCPTDNQQLLSGHMTPVPQPARSSQPHSSNLITMATRRTPTDQVSSEAPPQTLDVSLNGSDSDYGNSRPLCAVTPPPPIHQLRIPSVGLSSNTATDLMEEEKDMGYFSFSALSPISADSECGSPDKPGNLEDIIDDVLDNMDQYQPNTSCHSNPDDVSELSPAKRQIDQNFNSISQTGIAPLDFNLGHLMIIHQTPETTANGIKPSTVSSNLYCTVCCRQFDTKTDFKIHIRMHNSHRPHQCPFCEKAFTQRAILRTHIRIHTGERPFQCSDCPKSFADYSTFRKHQRIHSGEKPYVCDICFKGFAQSGNMIRHKKVHSKTKSIAA